MKYTKKYQTPKGFSDIYMSSDGTNLTRLWFEKSTDHKKLKIHIKKKT